MSVVDLPVASVTTPPPRGAVGRVPADPHADADPDVLFEVVNGARVEKARSVFEQVVAGLLHEHLGPFCRQNGLGRAVIETMFAVPGSGNDRRPDVAFVSYQSWPRTRGVPRVNAWPVAPDLAVEVVSPTDRAVDVDAKVQEYFAGGVKQVWLVWPPTETVHCYTSPTSVRVLTRADDLTGDPLIPGFRLPLADLFPPADTGPGGQS